jgi:hypothetical protein
MSKTKNMTPEQAHEWRTKLAERQRKYREANPEKVAERKRKYNEANREKIAEYRRKHYEANCQQAAADQFFQIQGAAEQISEAIEKYKTENNNDNNTDKPTG